MTFSVTEVSQCHIDSRCVTSVQFHNCRIFVFLGYFSLFFVPKCHIVLQCDTCHVCYTWDVCQTCNTYNCHVSLDIKGVIVVLLVSDLNKVGGKGVKKGFQGLRRTAFRRTALLSAEGQKIDFEHIISLSLTRTPCKMINMIFVGWYLQLGVSSSVSSSVQEQGETIWDLF
jgi:hypothetical protein